ncbi:MULTISPECIES: DUF1189 family protein [unclassified Virgibacillus]|uniref:DUF1189 family protein n=1 Tax=unclassified Virgibacillus TaxID=2620237 RepID=UPI0024DEF56A|nr:DUF1189 family protein [Virgibacillus sp. LDC-1]
MIFWTMFTQSLRLPNKQAVFRLNRTGMDITVFYMFILLGFVSVPTLIDVLTETNGMTANMNILFRLIYFFIFSYLPLTIVIFILLSLLAYIATGIAHLMKRKLKFSILWKMSAYTTTIPFLFYTVAATFFSVHDMIIILFIVYSLVLLIKIISIYPKRKKHAS